MIIDSLLYEKKTDELYARKSSGAEPLRAIPHLHRQLELIVFLDGKTYAYADASRVTLRPNDVFLTFPNQIHYYETQEPERYYIFIIDPDLVPELSDVFGTGVSASPIIPGACEDPLIPELSERLYQLCRNQTDNPSFRSLRKGYLLTLLSELLAKMTVIQPPVGDSGTLRTIVSYCTRHFAEDLSLAILEEKLHLNRYYISHLFSGKLGLGFNDYVNSLRINEACRLLTNSDASVTEIGSEVGFNTLRTFNRAFTRQLGVSPSAYRKQSKIRS